MQTPTRKILIVDDHPTNRKLLRATLEAEDLLVCEAADGIEALNILEHETVDAVISDILMPNMDGYQLCHELRRHPKLNTLPLIMYTNTYTSPGDRELAMSVGADEYVTKPASAAELRAALDRAKSRSGQRASSSPSALNSEYVMKRYANLLVHKLEKKNLQLEAAQSELETMNRELEQRVRERTAQLEAMNRELDSFCHSVSHDLRAPLRGISGFTHILRDRYRASMDAEGTRCLDRVIEASDRMNELIEDLLTLSRVSRSDLLPQKVNISKLAGSVAGVLRDMEPGRKVQVSIADNIALDGDPRLLRIVFENLLGNAWKFTSKNELAQIEIGTQVDEEGHRVCFVRDNGAGFDMRYAAKLFGAFQRLHSTQEFPGSGIGLATVQRVIHRHGGSIWAEGKVNEGATFFFTLDRCDQPAPVHIRIAPSHTEDDANEESDNHAPALNRC